MEFLSLVRYWVAGNIVLCLLGILGLAPMGVLGEASAFVGSRRVGGEWSLRV